ncbi:MAG: Gfo/Idh/MocA family oxidoreductase [Bacteroidales bacterium]
MTNRREFIKKTTLGVAGLYMGEKAMAMGKTRKTNQSGNETINLAVIGLNSRGYAHADSVVSLPEFKITHICDVDAKIMDRFKAYCKKNLGYEPATEKDFRKLLENKDIDAITIATPEHWHAPMAIMALQAGKHVYIEKPCSHNLYENELLIAAQKKYGKLVQMGNQQRSSITSALAIKEISEGIIGNVYFAKAWYANSRKTIGTGKKIAVPEGLDWDLWQGPAPREDYRDNVHPYNWHWFKTWGTGELHNNGTHEIDICRWALGVKYPTRVTSTGGRYFTKDDWQFFDTQNVTFEFGTDKMIVWEGLSCNGIGQFNRGRGSLIQGTRGTILLDRDGYWLYDLNGKLIKEEKEQAKGSTQTSDTKGFDMLTVAHFRNFANAIRKNEKLNAPIDDASVATHLCHLGNIAQFENKDFLVDEQTGKLLDQTVYEKYAKRKYQPGWEPNL